jgi:2-keto-3-deoxy-L-rhamnonate aldolase RhmA
MPVISEPAAIRANPVRARLSAGETVYGMFAVEFFTPGLCQIAANAGAEFVLFDMEHGGVGIDVLKSQFAFARGTGVVPLVRVPGLHYHLIAPVLDAGAMGIMVPMLETRAQAEQLAAWCRYRPMGRRGLGFGVGHDDYRRGDVAVKARDENDRTLVIALIETATGIANVEEILAVEGIDVGWLGHYDLTDSMGMRAEFDRPEFDAAVRRLVAACNANGKAAGFLATSVETAREWRAKGFRCLSYGSDAGLLQAALGDGIARLRAS